MQYVEETERENLSRARESDDVAGIHELSGLGTIEIGQRKPTSHEERTGRPYSSRMAHRFITSA